MVRPVEVINAFVSCATKAGLSKADMALVRPKGQITDADAAREFIIKTARDEYQTHRDAYRQLLEQINQVADTIQLEPAPVAEAEVAPEAETVAAQVPTVPQRATPLATELRNKPATPENILEDVKVAIQTKDDNLIVNSVARLIFAYQTLSRSQYGASDGFKREYSILTRNIQNSMPKQYSAAVNEVLRFVKANDVKNNKPDELMDAISQGLLLTPAIRADAFRILVNLGNADMRGATEERTITRNKVREFLQPYIDVKDPDLAVAIQADNDAYAKTEAAPQVDAFAGEVEVKDSIAQADAALKQNDVETFHDLLKELLAYYYSSVEKTAAAKFKEVNPTATAAAKKQIKDFITNLKARRLDVVKLDFDARMADAKLMGMAEAARTRREATIETILNVLQVVERRVNTKPTPPQFPPSINLTENGVLRELRRALLEIDPELLSTTTHNDVPLSQLLNPIPRAVSVVNFVHDGGRWRVAPWPRPNAAPAAPAAPTGRFSLAGWNNGANAKGAKPMSIKQVALVIKPMRDKLANPPPIFIYKNQADMAAVAEDAAMYQAAKAARAQGDFDTAPAAGYSFIYNGNPVVLLFADRLANAQHARFVFGHEIIGHYGLRAVLGDAQFDKLMNGLYDTNSRVRDSVDVALNIDPTRSKTELVEEYLADYAGVLETSLVARVWSGIKNALNRLGLTFGDESVRFLLNQARRYARLGQTSSLFNVADIAARLDGMENHSAATMQRIGNFVGVNERAGLLRMDVAPPTFNALMDLFRRAAGKGTGADVLRAKRQITDLKSAADYMKQNFGSMMNYRALDNAGPYEFDRLLGEMRDVSMAVKVRYNEFLAPILGRAVYGNFGGISEADENQLSQLTYAAREFVARRLGEKPDLGSTRLFTLDNDGNWQLNTNEARRLFELGTITFDQARDGFTFDVPNPSGGQPLQRSFPGVKGLTKDSIVWTGYLKLRQAMTDIELELLKAKYSNDIAERDTVYQELGELVRGGGLTDADKQLFETTVNRIRSIATQGLKESPNGRVTFDEDSLKQADAILVAFNKALTSTDADTVTAAMAAFKKAFASQTEADDAEAKLNDMRSRAVVTRSTQFLMQNKVKNAVFAGEIMDGAEKFTKRSIAAGYIPIYREGIAEIRVEARVGGKRVMLKDTYKDRLVYSQFDSLGDAEIMAGKINSMFANNTFQAEVLDPDTGEFLITDVSLVAVAGDALTQIAVHPELNYNEFVRGLKQFDINLDPAKMADVITALNTQNASARNRLQASFTPGYDMNMAVVAMSQHMESRASSIAKTYTRARLAELLNLKLGKSSRLWFGDADAVIAKGEHYNNLTTDPRATPEARREAQMAFHAALYKYRKTNPAAAQWDGSRATLENFSIGGRPQQALRHYNNAASTMAFIDGNRFVDETDFGSGKTVSGIRTYTGLVQLSLSLAQGVMNVLSLTSNWTPYMASYNPSSGFGGGFSAGKVTSELFRALRSVGSPGMAVSARGRAMNTAEFYDNMLGTSNEAAALRKQYGLQEHEARFIANEIREGVFIPAQFNALVGTARGTLGMTNRRSIGVMQKLVDTIMFPFTASEAAARRSAGLAAYRLAYARGMASHGDETRAQASAREFATNSIKLTLGEYSILNRPPAWRDGLQSFLFMYKTYPVTTVQLFSRLSRGGKLSMLAVMWALSGVAGLPFAEDMEDLIDTLAQVLGFQVGSVRALIAKHIEEVMPGVSPIVFKGLVNQILPIPADVASRVSVGDIFPGTGIFLAGANVGQEVKDIVGPAGGAILATAAFARDLVQAPFTPAKSLLGAVRESPVTAMRMAGDAYAYWMNDAIVDRRGYVVSNDMGMSTILTRLLGFYPEPAAAQYEVIRLSNRITGYQREMAATWRMAWVRAMMTGDREGANEIAALVNEWNTSARGTGLEIRNFLGSANRALLEARREATGRALRAAPISARPDIQGIIDAFTDE